MKGVPAFVHLPDSVLAELINQLNEEQAPTGGVIVSEGEVGDRLYLVVEGRAEVSASSEDGQMPLAMLGPGEIFGEIALLTEGSHRTARVTALEPLLLLSLHKSALDHLMTDHPSVREGLASAVDEIHIANFLKRVTPFTTLDAARRRALARLLERKRVQAGEVVVQEGEVGNSCYLVLEGCLDVLVRTEEGGHLPLEESQRRIATLGPDSMFGEVALLTDSPRTATVRATEPCELLVLHRDDLFKVIGEQQGDTAHRLVELVQMRARPSQVPGIITHHRRLQTGEMITTLKDPLRGAYYRLSPQGWFIWERLDGQHTIRDLTLDYLTEFKAFAPDAIFDVVGGLISAGFANVAALRAEVQATSNQVPVSQRMLMRLRGAVEWYKYVRGVDPRLTDMYRRGVRLLYTTPGQLVLGVLATIGLVAFLMEASRAGGAIKQAGAGLLLFLIPASFFSILVHEAGHAFTTKAFGREVNRVGIGWYWFGPVAFVDTSDMWLAARWPRIAVSLAGPYANLVLAGAASLVGFFVTSDIFAAALWQFALSSYISVLLNLNPLLEFDGYFVLMDLLERPNLRPRALRWLGKELIPTLWRGDWRNLKAHWLDVLYGIGSILYVGLEAWLIVALYRLLVQGWLAAIVPEQVAASLAWVLAAIIVVLAGIGIASDLKGNTPAMATERARHQ